MMNIENFEYVTVAHNRLWLWLNYLPGSSFISTVSIHAVFSALESIFQYFSTDKTITRTEKITDNIDIYLPLILVSLNKSYYCKCLE